MLQPPPENGQQGLEVEEKYISVPFQVLGVFPTPGRPAVVRIFPPSLSSLLTGGNKFSGGGQQGPEAGELAVGPARRQAPTPQDCRLWLLQA